MANQNVGMETPKRATPLAMQSHNEPLLTADKIPRGIPSAVANTQETIPRDTVDQIKVKKGVKKKNFFEKGDIIFWKGHVAVCLNSNQLIHAYGPKKKVVIMPIKTTKNLIKNTAKLKVKKIYKI